MAKEQEFILELVLSSDIKILIREEAYTHEWKHIFCHLHGSLRDKCTCKIQLCSCSWHLWNSHVYYRHIRLCLERKLQTK